MARGIPPHLQILNVGNTEFDPKKLRDFTYFVEYDKIVQLWESLQSYKKKTSCFINVSAELKLGSIIRFDINVQKHLF